MEDTYIDDDSTGGIDPITGPTGHLTTNPKTSNLKLELFENAQSFENL